MWSLILAATLSGTAVSEQREGMIGIRWDAIGSHVIHRIYKNSPAFNAGLHVNDQIIHTYEFSPLPIAGSLVELTIKRKEKVFRVLIERIPAIEIDRHDAITKDSEQ